MGYSTGVLVKGNKIHLKTIKGSVYLLSLVNGMFCFQFVTSVEQEGFSEKGKLRISFYQNTVSFSLLGTVSVAMSLYGGLNCVEPNEVLQLKGSCETTEECNQRLDEQFYKQHVEDVSSPLENENQLYLMS